MILLNYEYAIFVMSKGDRLKYITYILFTLLLAQTSCQPDPGGSNTIVFADVIGPYTGECADYQDSTVDLENRESSTLSVFAVNTTEAGVKTSCDRFDDFVLSVTRTSAAEIEFEKQMEDGSTVVLTYYSELDSIVLTQTGLGADNFIFAGLRG